MFAIRRILICEKMTKGFPQRGKGVFGLRGGGMSAATALVVAFVLLLAAQALSFIPLSRAGRLQPVA